MTLTVEFSTPRTDFAQTLVVLAVEGAALLPAAAAIDSSANGVLAQALALNRAKGAKNEVTEILLPAGLNAKRILIVGLGKPDDVDALVAEGAGAAVAARMLTSGETEIAVLAEAPGPAKISSGELAARIALGFQLRAYRFDGYRTTLKDDEKPSVARLILMSQDPSAAEQAYGPLETILAGVSFARDLVSEPANILYPVEMARRARILESLGATVSVLGEAEMARLGMGAILGVGQGSERESQLIAIVWQGDPGSASAPVALIGKGVCFDSGGISLKPGDGMWDMKWDMGGAAAVLGAMHVLAARKARANVVGIIAAVENMPDGKAQRPGDIVRSMSGQTIEVLNTDAEGRLILADALTYAQETYHPRAIIDLATLTGAILVALGSEFAGLFANDEALAEQLAAAAKAEGEGVWRMPLADAYDKKIKSAIADMQNIANNREAGASIGAVFIQRFVKDKTPWAHLDIAGTTWAKEDKGTQPKGGTGYGVRLLNRLIADHFEA